MRQFRTTRVLIVDDENGTTIQQDLSVEGIVECHAVRTAMQAIADANEEEYDYVILDMRMPILNAVDEDEIDSEYIAAFIDFAEVFGKELPHFEHSIGGWWCAAFLLEKVPWVRREKLTFVTSHVMPDHYEPFKKTDKLGTHICDRENILSKMKQLLERRGTAYLLESIKEDLEDGRVTGSAVRDLRDLFEKDDRKARHELLERMGLSRYLPYSCSASEQYYDRKLIYGELVRLLKIPAFFETAERRKLLDKLELVYSDDVLRQNAYNLASDVLSEIMNEKVLLASKDPHIHETDLRYKLLEKRPEALERELTFNRYLSSKVGDRRLRDAVTRLVLIGLFVNRALNVDTTGTLALAEDTVVDLGRALGFSRFKKEVPGFRRLMNQLALTANGTRDPLIKAQFLREEKKWLHHTFFSDGFCDEGRISNRGFEKWLVQDGDPAEELT